jgi:hypothetical protein
MHMRMLHMHMHMHMYLHMHMHLHMHMRMHMHVHLYLHLHLHLHVHVHMHVPCAHTCPLASKTTSGCRKATRLGCMGLQAGGAWDTRGCRSGRRGLQAGLHEGGGGATRLYDTPLRLSWWSMCRMESRARRSSSVSCHSKDRQAFLTQKSRPGGDMEWYQNLPLVVCG